jgi:alkylation response protein AidB-like acyl-CoA dehydrogenase
MAGYSGTPLPKLGIKPGGSVALVRAPEGFQRKLDPLPENVCFPGRGSVQLVLLFVRSQAELARRFPAAVKRLQERGGLWIIWPKKASGLATDLGEIEVRRYGMDSGFVDYKVCAVDQTWSGLLFARRRQK